MTLKDKYSRRSQGFLSTSVGRKESLRYAHHYIKWLIIIYKPDKACEVKWVRRMVFCLFPVTTLGGYGDYPRLYVFVVRFFWLNKYFFFLRIKKKHVNKYTYLGLSMPNMYSCLLVFFAQYSSHVFYINKKYVFCRFWLKTICRLRGR